MMKLTAVIGCVFCFFSMGEAVLKEEDQASLFLEVLLRTVEELQGRDLLGEGSEMLKGLVDSPELREALIHLIFSKQEGSEKFY